MSHSSPKFFHAWLMQVVWMNFTQNGITNSFRPIYCLVLKDNSHTLHILRIYVFSLDENVLVWHWIEWMTATWRRHMHMEAEKRVTQSVFWQKEKSESFGRTNQLTNRFCISGRPFPSFLLTSHRDNKLRPNGMCRHSHSDPLLTFYSKEIFHPRIFLCT